MDRDPGDRLQKTPMPADRKNQQNSDQTTTGAITGTVTDPSGALIPNVKITATNTATNITNTTSSNEAGVYNFPFLAIGSYIDRHNENPKPFIWTARASDILEKSNAPAAGYINVTSHDALR